MGELPEGRTEPSVHHPHSASPTVPGPWLVAEKYLLKEERKREKREGRKRERKEKRKEGRDKKKIGGEKRP